MRAMNHPDYEYSPWSEERRQRASEANKARIDRIKPYTGEINNASDFRRCTPERRAEIMSALTRVFAVYAKSGGLDKSQQELMGSLMADYSMMAHAVVREMALAIETARDPHHDQ